MSEKNPSSKVIPQVADKDVETWVGLSALTSSTEQPEDESTTSSLRPSQFSDYVGQDAIKDSLLIACHAAKKRVQALDHILLHGPPGLGKTSLARIIAHELAVGFKSTSGPVIERPGDLAAILTSLQPRDVLFIDEIHRLPRIVEEVLYPAMEDYEIDILVGQGPAARSIKIELKPFTLVGATTRTGLLTSPLRDRFGMVLRLGFYSTEELQRIVERSARIMQIEISNEASFEIGKRSRGTPRVANRLLRRVRDYAQEKADGNISLDVTRSALKLLQVDDRGLDAMDRLILETIVDKFSGGPVGIETISAALGEDRDTLEDVYEPYLVQEGFLARTRRGREITDLALSHLGRELSRRQQMSLKI